MTRCRGSAHRSVGKRVLLLATVIVGLPFAAGCGTEPQRIVSLSPSTTELLYALDLDDNIVAVDEQSSFPAEAPRRDGLSGFQPDADAILRHDPDVVVLNTDTQDVQGGMISKKLADSKVEVLFDQTPKNLDGLYAGIVSLGRQFDREEKADKLVRRLRDELSSIQKSVSPDRYGRRYYHEVDPTYYTATSDTFIGSVYEIFNLRNIATHSTRAAPGFRNSARRRSQMLIQNSSFWPTRSAAIKALRRSSPILNGKTSLRCEIERYSNWTTT